MSDFDALQQDCTEVIKDFLRRELGKDYYKGKLQAVIVTTNMVTGRTNVDSCNVPLQEDVKKMLINAREMLLMDRIGAVVFSASMRALSVHERSKHEKDVRGSRVSKKVRKKNKASAA